MLIVYLFKRFKSNPYFIKVSLHFKKAALKLKLLMFLLTVTTSYANDEGSPNQHTKYHIIKDNVVIGYINIGHSTIKNSLTYSLESDIKTKFLFKFKITGKEISAFENSVLTYSSVFRKVNYKVKVNHSVVFKDNQYCLNCTEKIESLHCKKIDRNLVTFYFKEPKNVTNVFCDNLKRLAPVEKVGKNKYKVQFSKAKYSVFHYENIRCVKTEAYSTLFDVNLILVSHDSK